MFNLKKELQTLPQELLTWDMLRHELCEVAWRCRRDLAPGMNARDLFELAYEKLLIKQAYPSDQYGTYYIVVPEVYK